MSEDLPLLEEYTDEYTGTRLTIERDIPEWPRITLFPPEYMELWTNEDIVDAIGRLLAQTGIQQKKRET